jgi:hypothetical protein
MQNEFYPGDKIPIKIICDNRKCTSAVRSFKFKLYRSLKYRHPISGSFDEYDFEISQTKEKGVAANEFF